MNTSYIKSVAYRLRQMGLRAIKVGDFILLMRGKKVTILNFSDEPYKEAEVHNIKRAERSKDFMYALYDDDGRALAHIVRL